jgi:hypothetical protein
MQGWVKRQRNPTHLLGFMLQPNLQKMENVLLLRIGFDAIFGDSWLLKSLFWFQISCCAFSLYNSSGQDARTTKFK